MIIIWVVDTTHSFVFNSNFSKWSIYLEDNVENKVFYRIGEGVVKFYSVVLFALGFTIPIYMMGDGTRKMMCCGIMNYEDEDKDNNSTGHHRESTPASISSRL